MSNERVLTKDIAEQFLEGYVSVDLDEFTMIEAAAAECLSTHEEDLDLNGLTTLSDAAAESFNMNIGQRSIGFDGLTSLSDQAAECLSLIEECLGLSDTMRAFQKPAASRLMRARD